MKSLIRERRFGVPEPLQKALQQTLLQMKFWGNWRELASYVQQMSDHFIQQSGPTPWGTPQGQAAYLCYFLPLNYARLCAVFTEIKRLQLPWKAPVVDIGSGPGTAHLAALAHLPPTPWTNWETSPVPCELHQQILNHLPKSAAHAPTHWTQQHPTLQKTSVVASYALNEWKVWPQALEQTEQLVIVEPSTQEAGRRLMEYRQHLIDHGFHIWAPCTHPQGCPLLNESKRDWCHDRIHFDPPSWWTELEAHLPMRNQTLTFSYLIASRTPPQLAHSDGAILARVIGDTLHEKGKTRQAVCRGPHREFLSWLKRDGEAAPIPHGQLIELPLDIEKRGNELRVKPHL
ncbi:MAG: small ribosomal subunit Rsm22 family protein [Bdellovibrionales bacterium]